MITRGGEVFVCLLDAGFVDGQFDSVVDGGIAAAIRLADDLRESSVITPLEEILEGFAELARHSAIDGEVDGVREADEEVDEHDQSVEHVIIEHVLDCGECVLHNVQHRDHGQRDFHGQEDGDDDDEHHGRAIGIAHFAAFALLLVLFEQFVALLLGVAQGAEQQHVQND